MLNDTITLNPSLLSFQPVASFSGTFNWLDGSQYTSGDTQKTYNASVIDGKNQYVNAGLSFTRRPDIDFIHMALAKRLGQSVGLGMSVKRFSTRSNTRTLLGAGATGFETGASVSYVVPPSATVVPLQIGLTADNLFHRARDERYVGPRQIGGGVKVSLQSILIVYGDLIENFSNSTGSYLTWSGGGEVAMGGGFFGRGGLMGGNGQKGFGFGGGWVGPKIGVNYGYQNRLISSNRSFQHAVTMDIFM